MAVKDKISAKVLVKGIVQGVFFRAETKRAAESLGVCGWVRNKPDNSVEAFFEGEEEKIRKAVEWCRIGAPLSRVDNVDVVWGEYEGRYETFKIRFFTN